MMLIYFDLDGPILDVSPKFYKIYTDLLNEYGHPGLSKEVYWRLKMEHTPCPEILKRTCPPEIVEPYIKKRLQVIENFSYLKHDQVIPGAQQVLQRLSQKHTLILVTLRNRSEMLSQELDYFDLRKYFKKVLSQDNNPGDWQTKVRLIRGDGFFQKKDAMMVGDTQSDIKAGKELGLITCAVLSGIRTEELLKQAEPDFLIADINSLEKVISSIEDSCSSQ
jgi:phosphoglycolate phosphatase-like HAD superfamily hydrolase